VEVHGGAHGGFDALATAAADTDRLRQGPADIIEIAGQSALDDRAECGHDLGVAQDVCRHRLGSRYQA